MMQYHVQVFAKVFTFHSIKKLMHGSTKHSVDEKTFTELNPLQFFFISATSETTIEVFVVINVSSTKQFSE